MELRPHLPFFSVPRFMRLHSSKSWMRLLAIALLLIPIPLLIRDDTQVFEGQVADAAGPVAFASVSVQGARECARSDRTGNFVLRHRHDSARITAAKPGYLIGWTPVNRGPLRIRLDPAPAEDNLKYAWV